MDASVSSSVILSCRSAGESERLAYALGGVAPPFVSGISQCQSPPCWPPSQGQSPSQMSGMPVPGHSLVGPSVCGMLLETYHSTQSFVGQGVKSLRNL